MIVVQCQVQLWVVYCLSMVFDLYFIVVDINVFVEVNVFVNGVVSGNIVSCELGDVDFVIVISGFGICSMIFIGSVLLGFVSQLVNLVMVQVIGNFGIIYGVGGGVGVGFFGQINGSFKQGLVLLQMFGGG